jgi:hypothetical protein
VRVCLAILALGAVAANHALAQTTDTPAYDDRLRASMAGVTSFQGPMDGSWTLRAGDQDLYIFQLFDRNGVVDGAWRDPRRPGALEASGFLDQAERRSDGLTLRMAGRVANLKVDVEGRLSGDLIEADRTVAVTLRRRNR